MSTIKLVTWDVDGTLYSLPAFKRRVFVRLALRGRFGLMRSMLELHEWIDSQRGVSGGRVDLKDWSQWEGVFAEERRVFAAVLSGMKPAPRALDLLESYRAQGVIQVALSDLESRYKLQALGLEPYFADATSAFESGFWKPSPVAFRAAQKKWGIKPHEHLHIGDRMETDGLGAQAAGCGFVLLDGSRAW